MFGDRKTRSGFSCAIPFLSFFLIVSRCTHEKNKEFFLPRVRAKMECALTRIPSLSCV